jgi:hypothetical protein
VHERESDVEWVNTGTELGDTILVGGTGNEVLTVVEGWPVLPVMMEVL